MLSPGPLLGHRTALPAATSYDTGLTCRGRDRRHGLLCFLKITTKPSLAALLSDLPWALLQVILPEPELRLSLSPLGHPQVSGVELTYPSLPLRSSP